MLNNLTPDQQLEWRATYETALEELTNGFTPTTEQVAQARATADEALRMLIEDETGICTDD